MRWIMVLMICAALGVESVKAGPLTALEIVQIENDLGIVLTPEEQQQIAEIAKPDGTQETWRVEAEARINQHRKADLEIRIQNRHGNPIRGAEISIRQTDSNFRFGGILNLKDFHDAGDNLLIPPERYQELFLSLFNSAGLGNGLKAKLHNGNEALLPAFFDWAQTNNLPVRGHLLIWPGNLNKNHIPATEPYDVLSRVEALEAALTNGSSQATIGALRSDLKTMVDYTIADWASKWSVYEWDVINEPNSNYRLQELLGYDQMAEWFHIGRANAIQPDCRLLINEFQIISARTEALNATHYTSRRDRYMANIDQVLNAGGPLERIGFQSRLKWERIDPLILYNRLDEFALAYGLEMVGTEFEIVDSAANNGMDFPETLRAQMTEEMLTTYFSHPLVTGLNAWTYMKDETRALCNYDGSVKLNGLIWYYLHRIRYRTNETLISDAQGRTALHAFKGDYELSVSYDGIDYPATLALTSNESVVIQIDITASPSPSEHFSQWINTYPALGHATNLLDHADTDPYNNLWEYAFDGNPLDGNDSAHFPYGVYTNGALEYIYWKRADAASRGLEYTLELTPSLTDAAWTNNPSRYTETVGTPQNNGFFITNRIPTDLPTEFIRMKITFSP